MPTFKTVQIEARQLNGFKIEATTGQHVHILDQPAPLGEDSGSTPLQYLLTSLAGCLLSTAYIIARQHQLDIQDLSVKVEGCLDTDIVAGKKNRGRAGFTTIQMQFKIDAAMSSAEKEQFLHELTRRCPVLDTIQDTTPVVITAI